MTNETFTGAIRYKVGKNTRRELFVTEFEAIVYITKKNCESFDKHSGLVI